jgi:NAD dependent epimerase/dehydratase family enzyme
MYIEFKSKTGRISPEQRWWTDKLTEQGFLVLTCRDWETAAQAVEEYLSGTYAIRSTTETK